MKDIKTGAVVKVALAGFALYLAIYYWPPVAGFLGVALSAFVPLLLGLALAYPLNILMSFYERHFFPNSQKKAVLTARTGLCLIFAILTLLGIIALVLWLIIPQLIDCVRLLLAQIPVALERAAEWLVQTGIADELVTRVTEWAQGFDWQSRLEDIITAVLGGATDVVGIVAGVVTTAVSGIATAFIAIIFAVYVLLGRKKLAGQFNRLMQRYLGERLLGKIRYVLGVFDDCFHRFIVGQCTEAVILGMLCMLGMMLLGLPYAPMIGALTAFCALIPIVGAFLAAGVGAFLILMQSPMQALIFLIFIVILQQLEGNLIYPHVVGSSIQLPGIWVLAAVTVGGSVMGIFGMLLGVPLAAGCYRLIKNDVNRGPRSAGGRPTG